MASLFIFHGTGGYPEENWFPSDDDPYVPLVNGQEAAKQLNVSLKFIPHAGHFNKASGYMEFPQLRDAILSSIRS